MGFGLKRNGVLAKTGKARKKLPKAVVKRGKGSAFNKNPPAFERGVATSGIPSSSDLFNLGKTPEIPTGNVAEITGSSAEGRRLLKKAKSRRV